MPASDTHTVGVGLWSMRSTAAHPNSHAYLYRAMVEDVRRIEDLGFDSAWFAEHRFWYDGWNPCPLIAAAAAAGATARLRLGTAMLVLPQHDAERVARTLQSWCEVVGDRLDVGVALGYRDEEFDGLGLPRAARGNRMDAALTRVKPVVDRFPGARLWLGGMAGPALLRGIRHGCGFLLPPTLTVAEVARVVERIRRTAEEEQAVIGRIGIVKDLWLDETGPTARDFFRPRLADSYREYGVWWTFRDGQTGQDRPDLVDKQVRRALDTAIVGDPGEVQRDILALYDVGVDDVVIDIARDFAGPRLRDALELFADRVLPGLR